MSKSKIQEALERAYSNPESDWLNPDNHDKVNIALGLLNIESLDKQIASNKELTGAVLTLQKQIPVSISELRSTITTNTDKVIKSNEESSGLNKKAIFWNKTLTIMLIAVTLIVGLLQAYVIWKTAQLQQTSEKNQQIIQGRKQ